MPTNKRGAGAKKSKEKNYMDTTTKYGNGQPIKLTKEQRKSINDIGTPRKRSTTNKRGVGTKK